MPKKGQTRKCVECGADLGGFYDPEIAYCSERCCGNAVYREEHQYPYG